MSGLLELSNQELKTTMTNMSRLLTYEVESIQKHMGKGSAYENFKRQKVMIETKRKLE